MASSNRADEGADNAVNNIPEDLVLLWTKDASTIKTLGTFVENDRQLLEKLIQCVHEGKDVDATKQKLSTLLGRGKDRKSVVIRARVLSRLIAIALGLRPHDITIDSETKQESWRPSFDFRIALRPRLLQALQDDNTVLSYLFKDVLEADDEVMTVIFCDPRFFKKYPVPLFRGCTLAVVQEVSYLWLSQDFLRRFYYYRVLKPLFTQLRPPVLSQQWQERHPPPEAMMMLYELLRKRTVKAGARLLEVMLGYQIDILLDRLIGESVNKLVILLMGLKNSKFKKCSFGDFENGGGEVRWHLRGLDQVRGCHGQSIIIGPSGAQTDSILLCWAARRGYSFLISSICQGYTHACQISPSENLHEDAVEVWTVHLLWKVALWCATRHGQDSIVLKLTLPSWVKRIDFNDYTGIQGCLPPLHLVSLLGDRSLLHWLCMSQVGIESGAYKTDYLGKTPLDHAMQFQLTTKNPKVGIQCMTNDIKDRMEFQIPKNNITPYLQHHHAPSVNLLRQYPSSSYEEELEYIGSYYKQKMSKPIFMSHSCIQELLQMPGVSDCLKELNDMYITQANFVLIGAALIASVAFVGWLQPPLGYVDYFQFTLPSPPAPMDTYEQYVAVERHLSVEMYVVFNALSFFLGIGTMLIGAKATLFVHDNDEQTIALMKVRKSIKWMLGFFIASMVCIMAAFICGGLAILPPIRRVEWSMIVSLCLGGCICLILLTWILFSLARDQIVKLKEHMVKVIWPFDKKKKLDDFLKDLDGSLVNEEDGKTLQDEKGNEICEQMHVKQPYAVPSISLESLFTKNQIPNPSKEKYSFDRRPSSREDFIKQYDNYEDESQRRVY